MNLSTELIEAIDRLSVTERWRLVKHVLDVLEHEQDTPSEREDYHQFLRATYGSLRETPLERGDQGQFEDREAIP